MRIHLLALPNAQTTRAYSLCGFTQMTINFARLLKGLGHHVTLYASEENEAPCDELVTCITKEEQQTLLGATPYQYAAVSDKTALWQLANPRMAAEIGKRKQPRDAIMLIGGNSQAAVCAPHGDLLVLEYSIGYQGSFARFRVFQSTAWRHVTYGAQQIEDGRFFDDVIPGFFDPADFQVSTKKPFALYVGRLVPRKGITVACQAAAAAGIPLKVIGHGDANLVTHGAEYLGALDGPMRNHFLSIASVVLCPTLYVEPFNCVAVEAQLSGTPVISTDWGGFTDTIEQGVTGYRCTYLGEFVHAMKSINHLAIPEQIRGRAIDRYSIDAVAPRYARYFKRLELLWGNGWNDPEPLK